jgi:cob(I)alamin adenosyltransferase
MGQTRLYGGVVVDKDHLRVQVYGTLDELNSVIGLTVSFDPGEILKTHLVQLQNDIFRISAILSAPDEKSQKNLQLSVSQEDITKIERWIDTFDESLPQIKNFILPGGSTAASLLHLARTVCRRAERHLSTLNKTEPVDKKITIYVNRLSDLLFVMARYANKEEHIDDVLWRSE